MRNRILAGNVFVSTSLALLLLLSAAACNTDAPQQGRVLERTVYTPCGDPTSQDDSPTTSVNYTAFGHEKEKALNTLDFGARHFSTKLCRFTSIDPVDDPIGSPYRYVDNNFLNAIDPDGRAPILVCPGCSLWMRFRSPAFRAGAKQWFRDQIDYLKWIRDEFKAGSTFNVYRLLTMPIANVLTGDAFKAAAALTVEAASGNDAALGYLVMDGAVTVVTIAGGRAAYKTAARVSRARVLAWARSIILKPDEIVSPAVTTGSGAWKEFTWWDPSGMPPRFAYGKKYFLSQDGSGRWVMIDAKSGAVEIPTGEFQFVRQGNRIAIGRDGHTDLGDAEPVYFAGHVGFDEAGTGTLQWWDENSGSYLPSKDLKLQAGLPLEKFTSRPESKD